MREFRIEFDRLLVVADPGFDLYSSGVVAEARAFEQPPRLFVGRAATVSERPVGRPDAKAGDSHEDDQDGGAGHQPSWPAARRLFAWLFAAGQPPRGAPGVQFASVGVDR